MVTVTCQHSGIEFEAATARTKQHPLIAALKNESMKRGNYRQVNEALDTARKQGGYTTIEEYMTLVKSIVSGEQKRTAAIHDAQAAELRRIKAQREEENALLKANGYTWRKVASAAYMGGDDDDPDYRWELKDPDGHEISKEQALDEIRLGRDMVRAKIQAIREAARIAADEKAQQEAQKRAAQDAERREFDAVVTEATNGLVECERASILTQITERQFIVRKAPNDYVMRGKLNGVAVVIVNTGSGYDDDGYWTPYCADPEAAGLNRAAKRPKARRFF